MVIAFSPALAAAYGIVSGVGRTAAIAITLSHRLSVTASTLG